jgi:hypothetical protein
VALAVTAAPVPAAAQEVDKEAAAEKPARSGDGVSAEKAPDKPAEKGGAEGASEAHYPPPSTRIKLLAIGLGITTAAWAVSYAAARAWPETPCVQTLPGIAIVPGTGVGNVPPVYCTTGPPGSNQLGIPVVGPWIALSKSGCATDEPSCSIAKPVLRGVAYVIDGVVQLAGLGLVIQALAMKTESGAPAKKSAPLTLSFRGVEVTPAPIVAPGATGLSLVGTF